MLQEGQSSFPDAARDAHHIGDPASVGAYHIEGHGPPLVLVPGMDGTGRLFYSQIPRLAPNYRVATLKLRDSADRMEILVEDLARLIRALSPTGEPAIVCGESFGGTLSMSLAHQHPELVKALVVINSFSRFLPQHRLDAALISLRFIPWGAMLLVRRFTSAGMHSRYTHRREIHRFLQEMRFTTKEGYLNRLRILKRYDMRPHLAEIRVPTLYVASTHDHLVPSLEQARYMMARVPNASLEILEGHGHICLIAPGVDLGEIIARWGGLSTVAKGRGAVVQKSVDKSSGKSSDTRRE